MEKRKISNTGIEVSALGLGTWAFGGDIWWGPQQDRDSVEALETALEKGIDLIDTAPVYGRGRSEALIGAFLAKSGMRGRVVLATKLGLSWEGRKVFHDLSRKKMLAEIDESRKRLRTDYVDIYQVHWPDPEIPVAQTAEIMRMLFEKKIIRAIGVSNYSVEQMKEFMGHAPLHVLQPPYNMFKRGIEEEVVPFCLEHSISLLTYIPLHSGILTGKFFLPGAEIPADLCRRNKEEMREPFISITGDTVSGLKEIAAGYGRSLTQLVLTWTARQPGITSVLAGARRKAQAEENAGSLDFAIKDKDLKRIDEILEKRQIQIHNIGYSG